MASFDWDKFDEAPQGGPSNPAFDWDAHPEIPVEKPRESTLTSLGRSTIDTVLPVAGAIGAGMLATPGSIGLATVPAGALGYATGKQGARLLNHYLFGDELPAQTVPDVVKQTGGDLVEGAMGEMTGLALGKGIEVAAPHVGKMLAKPGQALKGFAEKSAVNATGATGKQASEFADDAGRQLLDRGLVRFGDSQRNIADRVTKATKAAEGQIDQALTTLDKGGVKVDANKLYNDISAKIQSLKGDPSQADVVRMLERELDNLIEATAARGSTDFGVQAAEKIKRGYNRKAGNWLDPDKGMVGKELYQTFRRGVEDAAQAADPATAKVFQEGKELYGLLAPIREAAERRAFTTSQSPPGGFLDVTAALAGGAAKGTAGAIAAPVARRLISPRISSTVAVTADSVSKMMLKSPRMQSLAKQNPEAFRAAVVGMTNRINSGRGAISQIPAAADRKELDRDSSTPAQERVSEEEARRQFELGN